MIANCEITLARSSDAPLIAALSRDAIERGLNWSWTPQRVLRSMRDAATNTIVAREREMLAGFAIMKYREEDAHLLLMAVHSSRRRRGVASALLDWLEVTARVAGSRRFGSKRGRPTSRHASSTASMATDRWSCCGGITRIATTPWF